MVQREHALPHVGERSIPDPRNGRPTASVSASGSPVTGSGPGGGGGRLRVDARRNLESVLRAAREVFGELGYGEIGRAHV